MLKAPCGWALMPARRSGRRERCAGKFFRRWRILCDPPSVSGAMTVSTSAPDEFLSLLGALRPRLHRYCARMAGSALDGEDIVQDALAKAALHYDPAVVRQAEAWLFRVAHNAALDFLRRRALERSVFVDAEVEEDSMADSAEDPRA